MAYTRVYAQRISWENEPSINTPLNDVNLNKMDYALNQIDGTLATWDTTKANQSDLLLSVKTIDYDDEAGVFIFTWQNGTTKTVDLNIEKIPVSFSMSPQGVITMTTEDGTTYTADVGALIKTYTFTDSSVIDFTVTTDASGNKTVTADIVDGSIAGSKLQPNYLADCTAAKTAAETAQGLAEDSAEDAEAWANGTRGGIPVPSTDPTYENNARYWAHQANPTALANMSDVDIDNPANGQVLTYNPNTQKWENQAASGGAEIDDTTTSTTKVWSSQKVSTELSKKLSYADNTILGAKNLLPNARINTTYGSTPKFVTDEDGVVTVTGNASGNNYFYVNIQQDADAIPYPFDSVDMKLSGCPSGGSTSGYRMTLALYSDAEATTRIANYTDIGEGVIVPATSNAYYKVIITIPSGSGYNLTFKPMLRLATDTDDTYVPYAKTNRELTSAHKVTTLTVDTINWTQDVTSQSGTTLYKKQVNLNHVYANPSVDIGSASGSVLPTTAQQEAYDLVQYVTVDTTVPCLYLYASDIPTDGFYINVEGVD